MRKLITALGIFAALLLLIWDRQDVHFLDSAAASGLRSTAPDSLLFRPSIPSESCCPDSFLSEVLPTPQESGGAHRFPILLMKKVK